MDWDAIKSIATRAYVCGHCGAHIASQKGWFATVKVNGVGRPVAHIHVCHLCDKPTFFDGQTKRQVPGAAYGDDVRDVSDGQVAALYDEARNVMKVGGFTASVLACRKLLMHIAVSKGARAGLRFIEYVEYFASKNYIPPEATEWVDHIRRKGNEANHEITIMSEDDARDLLNFSEMLLKMIYEFPAAAKRKTASASTGSGALPSP